MNNVINDVRIYVPDMIAMCRELVDLRMDMRVYRRRSLDRPTDYGHEAGEFTTAFCVMYEVADDQHNIHYILANKDEKSAGIFGVPTVDDLMRAGSDFLRMSVLARRMLAMLDDVSDLSEQIHDEQRVLWLGILDKMTKYRLLVDKVFPFFQ